MEKQRTSTQFAPVLCLPNGVNDIDFYKHAFRAEEVMRLNNDDGSLHVAELLIDGAIFHLHEETIYSSMKQSPKKAKGTTVTIGLMVEDVHRVMTDAIKAGATLKSPVTDYDYGYRQGECIDPFGHVWVIEKKI